MVILRGKRGWLKIAEAAIAIVVLVGVVFIVMGVQPKKQSQDLTESARELLESAAKNTSIRDYILGYKIDEARNSANNAPIIEQVSRNIKNQINAKILGFNVSICAPQEQCALESYPSEQSLEIFVAERLISTTPQQTEFSPRKIRLFLWRIN